MKHQSYQESSLKLIGYQLNLKHIYTLFKVSDFQDIHEPEIFSVAILTEPRTVATAITEATRAINYKATGDSWITFSKLLSILAHKRQSYEI